MDFKRVSLIEEHHSYSFQQQTITQLVARVRRSYIPPSCGFLLLKQLVCPLGDSMQQRQ